MISDARVSTWQKWQDETLNAFTRGRILRPPSQMLRIFELSFQHSLAGHR
jgi:hypothetical protein